MTGNTLEELLTLCTELEGITENISLIQGELSLLQEKKKAIVEHTLPDLFEALGMEEIKLKSGKVVQLKRQTFGTFPKEAEQERYDTVLEYLRKARAENLLKNTVVIDKEGTGAVDRVIELLKEENVSFKVKENIHPQTYNKFIRESKANDPDFPDEAFGVLEVTTVEIQNK